MILCKDAEFYNIDCLDNGEEFGFEGCYNGKLDHPDPRPGHRIWIKKLHAEKLYKLFRMYEDDPCPKCTANAGWSNGYCSMCGFREDAKEVTKDE